MCYIEKKDAIYCLSAILSSSVGPQHQRGIDCGRPLSLFFVSNKVLQDKKEAPLLRQPRCKNDSIVTVLNSVLDKDSTENRSSTLIYVIFSQDKYN